jgi:hypothetical protein
MSADLMLITMSIESNTMPSCLHFKFSDELDQITTNVVGGVKVVCT